MKIIRTVAELRVWRAAQSTSGFVPTMGALHNGHLQLSRSSLQENNATLLSIFVNPSQFAPTEDLQTYPRTFDADVQKFRDLAANQPGQKPEALAVFAPTVNEMYPSGIDLNVDKQKGTFVEVLGCSHQLEGAIRPQFFRGVATVVTKLLNAAQADNAYFGQKDIQQTVVVRSLVRDSSIPTTIKIGETQREPNGLAMSSRNAYLSAEEREKASIIYKSLKDAKERYMADPASTSSSDLIAQVGNSLRASPVISEVEYVSVNDLNDFSFLEKPVVGSSTLSVAVRLPSGVRLLDNVLI